MSGQSDVVNVCTWFYGLLGRERPDPERNKTYAVERVDLTFKLDENGVPMVAYAAIWYGGAPMAEHNKTPTEACQFAMNFEKNCVGGARPRTEQEQPLTFDAARTRLGQSRSMRCEGRIRNGVRNFMILDPA